MSHWGFEMDWQVVDGAWVLPPKTRLTGVIHLLGGAFVGVAPQLSYQALLVPLVQAGWGVVAVPYLNIFDHSLLAQEVLDRFEQVTERLGWQRLPVYGLGHSLGVKLHLLCGGLFQATRAGNILISFNNYPVRRAVPWFDQLDPRLTPEFTPSPQQTQQLIRNCYRTQHNLLIRYQDDTLDQTPELAELLVSPTVRTLPGNHLTPLGPSAWQSPTFNPWQTGPVPPNANLDLHRTTQAVLDWLREEQLGA